MTWSVTLGGFPPIAKMLSYRVGTKLTSADREQVMHLARRLEAMRLLEAEGDTVYLEAAADPLGL